jgi:protein-S-isoprenylcysteine O-methyltransferase Ste14
LGPIAAGCGGFLVLLLFDWTDSRGLRGIKPFVMTAAVALLSFSFFAVLSDPRRFFPPPAVKIAGAVLCAPFFLLFVYSLFLEIPFRTTYAGGEGERTVVTTGTYALVRHPGVIWFFLFHACLVAATGSLLLLAALPFWTGMNVLLVAVEDTVFFPRTFGDSYREYKSGTPFLIPNRSSVRRFVKTFSITARRDRP